MYWSCNTIFKLPCRVKWCAPSPVRAWISNLATGVESFQRAIARHYWVCHTPSPATLRRTISWRRWSFTQQIPPSAALRRPYAMAGVSVFAADTDREAELLSTSLQQQFVNLRRGRPAR